MTSTLWRALALWLPLVVGLTGVFGFGYVAVQQNYRQTLDDPERQVAEDTAARLAGGAEAPAALVPQGAPVNLRESLALWVAVYSAEGAPLAASGELDGAPPQLPLGVFDTATWRAHKTFTTPQGVLETRVTWQPRTGVRHDVVLVAFERPDGTGGFVAAGRSMRAVEGRILSLLSLTALAWAVTLCATLLATLALVALGLL